MTLTQALADRITDQLKSRSRLLVAIDGPDAAGKTALADQVGDALPHFVVRASIDGFHNPRALRVRRGTLSAEGYYRDSFDYGSLVTKLLEPFASGAPSVATEVYDYVNDAKVEARETAVPEIAVLILDGVFLLRPELRGHWDTSVYLRVTPEESLRRAEIRDLGRIASVAEIRERYGLRYLPGQRIYREEAVPESFADFVIDNARPGEPIVIKAPGSKAPS